MLGGGESNERDVSAASAAAVIEALRASGHSVTAIDPATWPAPARFSAQVGRNAPSEAEGVRLAAAFRANLRDEAFWRAVDGEVIFLALHGGMGESGELKAELEFRGLVGTGASAAVMARSWDKQDTVAELAAAQVRVPWRLRPETDENGELSWPEPTAGCIVKPALGGSSINVFKCATADEIAVAVKEIDGPVLVEELLPGPEFTVGVVGSRVLPPVLIEPGEGWFGYEQKYQAGRSREICPAPIDDVLRDELVELARRSVDVLGFGAESYARVDIMLDTAGRPCVLEVNSLPGLTGTSLLPLAARAAGWDFPRLCAEIVRLATA
ncbi:MULTISPECIES: ATP-grasp domain-containing protein [unclassified Nocardia]|uniref:D-alanine--D-alanine ligase family protein n=1 Tax=unclassified Nocardia TaxID=2637762 RepID=UPI001CE4AC65|nr:MULTISPECIES: ATP-grasp domain-containing protein [unclassified Nocardia]